MLLLDKGIGSHMKNFVALFVMCLVLNACGFQPMHGKFSGVDRSAYFDNIAISNIPNREGQFLRNALIDRFYTGARPESPKYTLKINPLQETKRALDVTILSDTTREQLTVRTTMELIENDTNKSLLKRNLYSKTSYNVLASEFATRVSEQNTRENALNDLARQIEFQISLFQKTK